MNATTEELARKIHDAVAYSYSDYRPGQKTLTSTRTFHRVNELCNCDLYRTILEELEKSLVT